jgi:diguanylate cyclase (GGDEF)-like protein/PAS domain S-box-containing protein
MSNFRLVNSIGSGREPSLDLSADLLAKFFPFGLAFDRAMQLVQIGDALRQLYPTIAIGSLVEAHFVIKYPDIASEFAGLCDLSDTSSDSLILLESRHNLLRFQGQTLYAADQDIILFLGLPQVTDFRALQALEVRLSQPPRGSTADYLLLLQARTRSLSDLRYLANHLAGQRSDWQRTLSQAELLAAVVEQAPEAIAITDTETKIIRANAAFELLTDYTQAELLGQSTAVFLEIELNQGMAADCFWQTVSTGQLWQGRMTCNRKNGSGSLQDASIFPIQNKIGKITYFACLLREAVLQTPTSASPGSKTSLSLFQATFEATADGILVTNTRGYTLNFNQKFIDLWQIPEADTVMEEEPQILQYVSQLLKDPDAFEEQIRQLYRQPERESQDILELQDGRFLEGRSRPQQMHEQVIGRVWSFQDVTERHLNEARIRYQASHDQLTGLPNRMLFNDRLATALFHAAQTDSQLAVMFLDLDRFKLVNDSLGHAAGDRLLQEVALRLKSCLRESDLVARWAGDEFTLLLPNIRSLEDATAIAQKILLSLRPDYDLEGHTLHVSSSIGIAFYPNDGGDAETLLKNADAALYRAKDGGRNGYHVYTSTINSEASEWLALENQLHRALERQEFVLYYQPQINVLTGEIIQMEALLRWQHPELGLVPPGKFISILEENGLIVPIGEWVLRSACAQACAWQAAGIPPLRVAVNLSARQLREANLLNMIERVLSETGLQPCYLELEITETTVMKNVDLTCTVLNQLKQMGISTAMDDFGTGYSSLGYLKKFPFHTLKIDQSFVRDLDTDPNDRAIVWVSI